MSINNLATIIIFFYFILFFLMSEVDLLSSIHMVTIFCFDQGRHCYFYWKNNKQQIILQEKNS